mmetsp:Transcript_31538/g.41762  ORF Transcript_31538/g.41762 Transcript_31538/m.41762 type:complete len:296 (+) Transcript_31538:1183-2070(+)
MDLSHDNIGKQRLNSDRRFPPNLALASLQSSRQDKLGQQEKQPGTVGGALNRLSVIMNPNANSKAYEDVAPSKRFEQKSESQNRESMRESVSGLSAMRSVLSTKLRHNLKAAQAKYNNFINDQLKDVSDKVKEVVSQLNLVKDELAIDYELNDKRTEQSKMEAIKNKQVLKHLMNPVKVRQAAKKKIKKELDDHLANYPQNAHELPGMRRKKEKEHNINFLKDVVTALKIKDDPIKIAQKEIRDTASKKQNSTNKNMVIEETESESGGGSDAGDSDGDSFVEGRGSVDSDSSVTS